MVFSKYLLFGWTLLNIEASCRVEKTMDKVDDACKFTTRLLKQGDTIEITSLKNVVCAQLRKILATAPEPEVNTSIEFVTDVSKYQAAVKVSSLNKIH